MVKSAKINWPSVSFSLTVESKALDTVLYLKERVTIRAREEPQFANANSQVKHCCDI